MLENKIQLNQAVSESKRDVVINQSNQNSTDQKFETAMYQSRQQQLNTEQRQSAARNDHAQQQERQQQQTKARELSERNAEQVSQAKSKNADKKTSNPSEPDNVNSTEITSKAVERNPLDSDSKEDSLSEQELADKLSEKNALDKTSSEETTIVLDDSTTDTSDTQVDSTSWLDTFMKIVAHNEQSNQDTISQVSTELDTDESIETTTEIKTSSDILSNFLFGSSSSNNEEIVDGETSPSQDAESEIKTSGLTSVSTDKNIKSELSGADGENVEQQNSTLLNNLEKPSSSHEETEIKSDVLLNDKADNLIKSDALTLFNSDVSLDLQEQGSPVFANSALQQQMRQEQSIDNKQPSVVEQNAKTILSFANPTLSEMIKRQNTEGVESNQLATNFDDELEGLKKNTDGTNATEQKLDSELKSMLDIKTASIMATTDGSTKTTESINKNDIVDVNGVQLDKTLQLPKLEHSSQVKTETLLRENILFNKQEMANHMQQQIGMMMSKNMKSIDIRLDPPELGSMQIKLTMNNDQAAVNFVVSNQQAKDALEASIPRLRELLEQQGMDLAESDVQHGSAQGEAGSQDDSNGSGNSNGMSNEDDQDEASLIAQEQLNRSINSPWNVDYYA